MTEEEAFEVASCPPERNDSDGATPFQDDKIKRIDVEEYPNNETHKIRSCNYNKKEKKYIAECILQSYQLSMRCWTLGAPFKYRNMDS